MSILQTLGWTFIHALWQVAAIAILAWAVLGLCRSARARYGIGLAGLLLMAAAPAVTFCWLQSRPAEAAQSEWIQTAAVTSLEHPLTVLPTAATSSEHADGSASTHSALAIIWLGRCWIAGVVLVAAWNAAGVLRVGRLRRDSFPLEDLEWTARLNRLIRRFHLHRGVGLFITHRLDCPAVVGWFKPVILWPAAALTGLTPRQIDALLAHELAHICRHDYLVNFIQAGIETLLFFHPCVWWLSRRIRQERENCCDDLAAQMLGSRMEYAEALVAMESMRQAPSLSLSANGGSLMKRIQRLLDPSSPAQLRGRSAPAAILLLAGLVTVSLWSGRVAPTSAEPTTQPTTEPAAANVMSTLLSEVLSARNASRDLHETKSAFAPEVARAREREQLAMQKWTAHVFELCKADDWEAKLDAELTPLSEPQADQKPPLTRGDLAEIMGFAAREARLQLGEESEVTKRLNTRSAAMKVKESMGRYYELAMDEHGMEALAEKLAVLKEKSDEFRAKFGPNSERMKEVQKQMVAMQKRLAEVSEIYANSAAERAEKIAAEVTARFQHSSEALMEQRAELNSKLEKALQTHSENSPEVLKLRAELDALAATEPALAKLARNRNLPAESTYGRYQHLSKEREELVAEIQKRRGNPTSNASELAELEGVLKYINNQIDAITNVNNRQVYVGGQVQRAGVYSVSEGKVTLKQMLIKVGLLEESHDLLICVIRRDPITGEEKIYRKKGELFSKEKAVGSEGGDLFLKPDDQIVVGIDPPRTDPTTEPGT